MPRLGMFTPEDLRRAEETGGFDVDTNILNLRPDPVHFVTFLKSLDRSDVVSDLFVRLLEAYRESKVTPDADPMRYASYLLRGWKFSSLLRQDFALPPAHRADTEPALLRRFCV